MAALNVIQTQEGEYALNYKEDVIAQSIKFEVYGTGTKSEMTQAVWAAAPRAADGGMVLNEVECTEIGESYAIVYAKYKYEQVDDPSNPDTPPPTPPATGGLQLAQVVANAHGYGAITVKKITVSPDGTFEVTGEEMPKVALRIP